MIKIFHFSLINILYIFCAIGWKSNTVSCNVVDYTLEYIHYTATTFSFTVFSLNHAKGKLHENVTLNLYGQNITKDVIVYEISIKNDSSSTNCEFCRLGIAIRNKGKLINFVIDYSRPNFYIQNDHLTTRNEYKICNLFHCEIGISFYGESREEEDIEDKLNNAKQYFYFGFVKSNEYENLILKLIPRFIPNNDIFSVAFCPYHTWIKENTLVKYIVDKNNTLGVMNITDATANVNYYLKLSNCHKQNGNTFLKCGRLDQMFLPSIDVGYDCYNYKIDKTNEVLIRNDIHNLYERENNITIFDNYTLTCYGDDIINPGDVYIGVVSAKDNYKTNSIMINTSDVNFKFYSGQRIQPISLKKMKLQYMYIKYYYGHYYNFIPQCIVPEIDATLRLKVNGIVQKFKNVYHEKYKRLDIYEIKVKEGKNASIGCHAVPDKFTSSLVNDFYKYRYKTQLIISTKKMNTTINNTYNIESMDPDSIYKCVLIGRNIYSKNNEKINYIKETKFLIKLTKQYGIISEHVAKSNESKGSNAFLWIILGVLIFVCIILIIRVMISMKLKLKQKKFNNIATTTTSLSTDQSENTLSTSSAGIKSVSVKPKLRKKSVIKN